MQRGRAMTQHRCGALGRNRGVKLEPPSTRSRLPDQHTREFTRRKTIKIRDTRPELFRRVCAEEAAGLGTQASLEHIQRQTTHEIMRDFNALVSLKPDDDP